MVQKSAEDSLYSKDVCVEGSLYDFTVSAALLLIAFCFRATKSTTTTTTTTHNLTANRLAETAAIDAVFGLPFASCSATHHCPMSTQCKRQVGTPSCPELSAQLLWGSQEIIQLRWVNPYRSRIWSNSPSRWCSLTHSRGTCHVT